MHPYATSNPGCQSGRIWRRVPDGPGLLDYSVKLNPAGGVATTDTVVFPVPSTEGVSARFFFDPRPPALLGGTGGPALRGGRTSGTQWDVDFRGEDSVAFGLDTTALGQQSCAMGSGATATHAGSFVWSDRIGNASSFNADDVTFGALGGFRVLCNGPGTPAFTIAQIYLDADDTVATGNLAVTAQSTGNTVNALTAYQFGGALYSRALLLNTSLGLSAAPVLAGGNSNTALGNSACALLTTGNQNTAVGASSLAVGVTATGCTAVGFSALALNTASSGCALGWNALSANTTGASNTACGTQALSLNVTGASNSALGFRALLANLGSRNTACGALALSANTTGTDNTAMGQNALLASVASPNSSAFGSGALILATGGGNTAVGSGAGGALVGGGLNTFLGAGANAAPANDGCIVLGANAAATASNQLVIHGQTANTIAGTAVLVAGTIVVASAGVTATSVILLTSQVPGGVPGFLQVSARTAGVSFTILSSNGADTSTVGFLCFEV